jgi:hypothetical protein
MHMKTTAQWLFDSPARFFLVALALTLAIMIPLDFHLLQSEDRKWLWIEAHSLLFDLLVFGLILLGYTAAKNQWEKSRQEEKDRQQRVARHQHDIDDFRAWPEKEATLRIVGAIKRLNREGVSAINLSECHLLEATLLETNLAGANLRKANLAGAKLWRSNLKEAKLIEANLREAALWGADLRGADLWKADLRDSDLRGALLQDAYLADAQLEGASVHSAEWLSMLNHWNVKGAEYLADDYYLEPKETFSTFVLRKKAAALAPA